VRDDEIERLEHEIDWLMRWLASEREAAQEIIKTLETGDRDAA
jgi:hypothetical protein